MRNISQKIFPVLCKLRKQNSAKLIAFHAKSSQKKICAKIAQIWRKRFSHGNPILHKISLLQKISTKIVLS